MVALFCIAFGTVPSTDGCFINIIEGWWHRALFNTSTLGRDGPQATNILGCSLLLKSFDPKCFQQHRLICKSDTFRMTKPQKNAIFKAETSLFWDKWLPCFSDTVRVEIKDIESLPSGNNSYLWTIKVCLNNSSASRLHPSPNSGIRGVSSSRPLNLSQLLNCCSSEAWNLCPCPVILLI